MALNTLIALTDRAAKHLKNIIARHKNGLGLRISIRKSGCSGYRYSPEVVVQEGEDDIRIDTVQGVVVFIDYQWLSVLQGTVIDLVDQALGQKRIVFQNANVANECGCGESFSVKKENE